MRILVVDDSEGIRRGIGTPLQRAGHECDFGVNGVDALRFALKKSYDLILSDIQMPVMDGIKFIGRLRMGGPNTRTPVLVFSSCHEDETVMLAAKLGIQAYILKPTDEPGVIAAVRKIFKIIGRLEESSAFSKY